MATLLASDDEVRAAVQTLTDGSSQALSGGLADAEAGADPEHALAWAGVADAQLMTHIKPKIILTAKGNAKPLTASVLATLMGEPGSAAAWISEHPHGLQAAAQRYR